MNIPNDDKKQTEEWVEEEPTPDSYDNDEEDEAVEEEPDPAESDDNAAESEEEREAEDRIAAFRKLTAEEDAEIGRHTPVTLSFILGGDILGGKWFRRHFWYMVMLVGMAIVYVSNRYSCQQEMLETKVLSDTLLDRRYKALTRSSQLKERTRRSRIEESLVDTTLRTSITPSYNLRVE